MNSEFYRPKYDPSVDENHILWFFRKHLQSPQDLAFATLCTQCLETHLSKESGDFYIQLSEIGISVYLRATVNEQIERFFTVLATLGKQLEHCIPQSIQRIKATLSGDWILEKEHHRKVNKFIPFLSMEMVQVLEKLRVKKWNTELQQQLMESYFQQCFLDIRYRYHVHLLKPSREEPTSTSRAPTVAPYVGKHTSLLSMNKRCTNVL